MCILGLSHLQKRKDIYLTSMIVYNKVQWEILRRYPDVVPAHVRTASKEDLIKHDLFLNEQK